VNGLFYPESVAVIGASESVDNLGKEVVEKLVNFGYRGKIYAVGPQGGEIFGVPIYRSVDELPGKIELAVIIAPARFVSDMLDKCGEKGARWAIIETAGFRERGAQGKMLEEEIIKTSKKFGIRFVGPNCLGVVNTAHNLYTFFFSSNAPFRKGNIGIFSQSGGVGLSYAEKLCTSGVGVSKFVSIGNKLDLDEADYLAYMMDDPDTAILYFYLEDFKRGRAFADLARRCSKPIILHKSNIGDVSRTIALSHTAALATDDPIVDAVCRECGILRVHSFSEAISVAQGLSLPPLKGKNLAVLSRSGGHAVLAADMCATYGFSLPALAPGILDEAQSHTRAGVIRLGNPMDLGDIFDISIYHNLVEKILRQENIDGVVFIHTSPLLREQEATRQLVKDLWAISRQAGKPVATVIDLTLDETVYFEKSSNLPFFLEPAAALYALSALSDWTKTYAEERSKPGPGAVSLSCPEPSTMPDGAIEKWFSDLKGQNRQPLLHEALNLLDLSGIPTIAWQMATSLDQALEAAQNMGLPVALKAVAPSLLHKSDKGGLALDVRDADSLRNEWLRLQKVSDDIAGVVVQKMAPASRELVAGGKRDPSFGPVVLTGLGGIMVEVMKDVSMRLAPIDSDEALKMLGELSGKRLLGRFRGMPEADLKAAARILVQLSRLMHRFPQIREMDLNPVSVYNEGKGAAALDVRLLISE
jgi:acetyltransferase